MNQILIIKFKENGEILKDIIDRRIVQYSHNTQSLVFYIPKTLTGTPVIKFQNDHEVEMINGYCEEFTDKDIDNNAYIFKFTRYYTQYDGFLTSQILLYDGEDEVWASHTFKIEVVKGVKGQDYTIEDPDISIVLQQSIDNIETAITKLQEKELQDAVGGKYSTVVSALHGLKNELDVLIGGDLDIEDLNTVVKISNNLKTAQENITSIQEKLDKIIIENVPVATNESYGVVKSGSNINIDNGILSLKTELTGINSIENYYNKEEIENLPLHNIKEINKNQKFEFWIGTSEELLEQGSKENTLYLLEDDNTLDNYYTKEEVDLIIEELRKEIQGGGIELETLKSNLETLKSNSFIFRGIIGEGNSTNLHDFHENGIYGSNPDAWDTLKNKPENAENKYGIFRYYTDLSSFVYIEYWPFNVNFYLIKQYTAGSTFTDWKKINII